MPGINVAIILLGLVAESPTNEWAYGHWNHLVSIANAFATQQRCPRLVVNSHVLAAISEKYRIRIMAGGLDLAAVTKMKVSAESMMKNQSMEEVCALGTKYFGPNGTRVKDLLIHK
ncbi:hypothetical protein [Rhizobium sp.]